MRVTTTPIFDLAERARAVVIGASVSEMPDGLVICIEDVATLLAECGPIDANHLLDSDESQ